MKHYQVGLDVEVTGVKNGLYQIDINKSQLQKNGIFKELFTIFNAQNVDFWHHQEKIQNIDIPPIDAKLLKKANVTDIMGYTQNIAFLYLVYSEKFINIIKTFDIGRYYTFEVLIENITNKYYLLFMETIPLEEIDYQESIIYKGLIPKSESDYFTFDDFTKYKEFAELYPIHGFKKIAISKEYSKKDIIKIQASSRVFYSERLIDFLLDCGITGLQVAYNNSIQLEFV